MKGASQIAPLGVRLPDELKEKVQDRAKVNGRSMNAEIVDVIERSFSDTPNQEVVSIQKKILQIQEIITLKDQIIASQESSINSQRETINSQRETINSMESIISSMKRSISALEDHKKLLESKLKRLGGEDDSATSKKPT